MQQVNLYQPILRKQEKVFSAKTLLQGNLIVLAGLMVIFAYTVLQTQSLRSQLEETKKQRDDQAARLAQLTRQYPVKPKDASLAARIEKSRTELQHKRLLLQRVNELGLESSVQFSDHLAALARQDLPSLWLQQIQLRYGQQIMLQGNAQNPEAVPVYLQRLSKEDAFSGTSFKSVVISRNEEYADRVDFSLNTQMSEEERQQ